MATAVGNVTNPPISVAHTTLILAKGNGTLLRGNVVGLWTMYG
jgi:hypothetical protein